LPFTPRPFFGLAQVVKESSRIRIGFLDLVPEAGDLAGLKITVYQGCLAASRRTGDPDHRPVPHAVDQSKQSFPWKDPPEDWANNITHDFSLVSSSSFFPSRAFPGDFEFLRPGPATSIEGLFNGDE
jgi:hypothetical protein